MPEMEDFAKEELQDALRSIISTLGKCEKSLPKLRPGTAQHTLLERRIAAFRIATVLIERQIGETIASR